MSLILSPEHFDNVRRLSGVPLKELATIIGYDSENLGNISKLIKGEIKDYQKRLVIYLHCLQKVNLTLKASEVQAEPEQQTLNQEV